MMTAKANKVGKYHPWTTYVYAREEARRRGDRRVGTEHLVLGLLREPDIAQVLGCDLGAAREALDTMDRRLGRSESTGRSTRHRCQPANRRSAARGPA